MAQNDNYGDSNHEYQTHEEAEQRIRQIFDQIPRQVPVILFFRKRKNDVFTDAARQGLSFFSRMTDKIVFEEYDLSHKLAKKYHVSHSPTILIDPQNYHIQWLGAPIGEEGRIFVEAMLLVGFRQSQIGDQAKKVLDAIKEPRRIRLFVSHSCPYCPHQALNAMKSAVEKPDLISLEIIDIQANPELARQYNAQAVPQTYANEILIAQGAQPEELFMASLQKMEQQTVFIPDSDAEEVETDLVIVGGGPAGLTAGIYAARSGLKSVVLERNVLGGQVSTTPVVENYPGLTSIGGKRLVEIMVTHALEYIQIFQGEEVMKVEKGMPMTVVTNKRRFITKAMLLATGATHRHLDVPSEERLSGRGVSYCSTCDGPLFTGYRVIVVGGGDSAATDALHLKNIGVDVILVHWTEKLDAQDFLARQLHDNHIPVMYNTRVKEIMGDRAVEAALLYDIKTGQTKRLKVGGVFIAVGYQPTTDLAVKIGVKLTPRGYIEIDQYRTNVPGVYAAGDVVGGFNQIVTASGHGAEAALTIFEDQIHPYWKQERKTAKSA